MFLNPIPQVPALCRHTYAWARTKAKHVLNASLSGKIDRRACLHGVCRRLFLINASMSALALVIHHADSLAE